jgi:hypothetical protein
MAKTIRTRQGRAVPSQARPETSVPLHAPPRHVPKPPSTPSRTRPGSTVPAPRPPSPRTDANLALAQKHLLAHRLCPETKMGTRAVDDGARPLGF